jgi:predicted dehydrogenase
VLVHTGGAVTTLTTSFDVVASEQPRLEIHGPQGSLSVPDPNHFDGDVRHRRAGDHGWTTLPVAAGHVGAARGIGVADLAAAIAANRPHRASAEVALHVLDIMESLVEAAGAQSGRTVQTSCTQPEPVPLTLG